MKAEIAEHGHHHRLRPAEPVAEDPKMMPPIAQPIMKIDGGVSAVLVDLPGGCWIARLDAQQVA